MKSQAGLLCLLVEPVSHHLGREGSRQSHAVNDGETDCLETKGLLGLSQPTEEPLLHVSLSPQCRTLHKPTICPAVMCVFNSIRFQCEFVASACLASCCLPFR